MAKRFKYGANCQTINMGRFHDLMPVLYHEVAAGETVSGTVTTRLMSDTTSKPILNRAYMDMIAVYIPFRLLWPEFPEWMSKSEEDRAAIGEPPKVTDIMVYNFERTLCLDNSTTNVAFLRYAYNLVWNTFFRRHDQNERTQDDNSRAVTSLRPSTFETRLKDQDQVEDATVNDPTSARSIREAMGRERFNKLRNYYGDRYTDYLASLGVEATWSILEEPEIIGQKHVDLPFRITKATAETEAVDPSGNVYVGDPGGLWDGTTSCKVKRTFCPEHGLVAVYAVPKLDSYNELFGGHVNLIKNNHGQYWSPEYAHDTRAQISSVWAGSNQVKYTPKYEDYRCGQNLQAMDDGAFTVDLYASTDKPANNNTAQDYMSRDAASYESFFLGTLDEGKVHQYVLATQSRLSRLSPVPPSGMPRGVA